MAQKTAIIIGAGPAGLTAAYKLLKETDIKPIILEESEFIGGISRTAVYKGNRMDLGGHRFFSKNAEVNELWRELIPMQGAPSYDDKKLGVEKELAKAKEKKGLTHREASVLLACENPDKIQEMYALAHQIKLDLYGNRIVMFAPLYLSNYCVNGCTYCPYHYQNKHIARKKLTQEEIRREVII